jgi:tRNA 2-selenouridine synthase SelU
MKKVCMKEEIKLSTDLNEDFIRSKTSFSSAKDFESALPVEHLKLENLTNEQIEQLQAFVDKNTIFDSASSMRETLATRLLKKELYWGKSND